MEGALLQEALLDEFGETVPAEMDQVQLQYLRVYSDTQANELFIRLLSEETDFATLREEIESPDAEISGIGGDLKWYPKALLEEQFSVEFAEEAFALGTGVFTQTIESEYGGTSYYVVEIVAHEERLVDDQNRTLLARIAFDQWLEEQMALVERLDYDATALFPESAGIETNPLGQ